jgi:hypothetical protein
MKKIFKIILSVILAIVFIGLVLGLVCLIHNCPLLTLSVVALILIAVIAFIIYDEITNL